MKNFSDDDVAEIPDLANEGEEERKTKLVGGRWNSCKVKGRWAGRS